MEGKTQSSVGPESQVPYFERDLLEPQFYPDPGLFRASLENITRDEVELKQTLTSNKAILRVLAPYLKIIQKDHKRFTKFKIKKQPKRSASIKFQENKRLQERLPAILPDVREKYEMITSIHETADILQALLNASTAVSYLVNPTTNELFQLPRHVATSQKVTWKIIAGTTIAAYAAFTKKHVTSSNILTDERFPQGLGFPSTTVKYAMCVPIIAPNNKVIGVYEFSRNAIESQFDKRDVQVVLAVTGWMGVAIFQNSLYSEIVRHNDITEYLVQLTDHHLCELSNKDKILSNIVMFAKYVVGAELCKLYIIEKESKDGLVVAEYDQGLESNPRQMYKRRSRKQLASDSTPLARALFNKEIVNISNDECDISYDRDIRSLICVPIVCGIKTVGAIEMLNKNSAGKFTIEDEELLQKFALFCNINLNHLNTHGKVKSCELQNKIITELLFHHIKPCSHDKERIAKNKSVHDDKLPEEFFTFTWFPSPDEMPKLAEMTVSMFHAVFGDSFMAFNDVPRFVLTVQRCYRPNPYHNFLHAFVVTHAMANIVNRYHRIFTRLEMKGLMVAALCHDVDHRGYTNNFIQLTQHYLSTLYESSHLENHHFAVTKLIIEQSGMFKYIKQNIYNQLLEEIYELIIATDLSLYFQGRMELMGIADEKSFTFKDPNHRRLVKGLVMTACDLSGQTKPFPICKKITEDVYEEFFQQGDVEKAMGLIPLPTMDRNKKTMIAENQVQFLSIVVLPCVEIVSRFFRNLSPVVWDARVLIEQWRELIEMKDVNTWNPEESVPTL